MFEQIKWDERGLVPAIVQNIDTKQVLMMAYMNAESLQQTIQTGETVFWSRSREELWHKGATSGNTQTVREIYVDCDGDTLLVLESMKLEHALTASRDGIVKSLHVEPGQQAATSQVLLTLEPA